MEREEVIVVSHRSVVAYTLCCALLTLTVLSAQASSATQIGAPRQSSEQTSAPKYHEEHSFQNTTSLVAPLDSASSTTSKNATPLPAVAVAKTIRPTTIAMLLPADNSPFISAGKIVSNGLVAASKMSPVPANILMIESPDHVPMNELLEAAIASGADVVVGPLQRERVQALVTQTELPIPIVALNTVAESVKDAPQNLLMMSISTEAEAEYVANLALQSLSKPSIALLHNPAQQTSSPALEESAEETKASIAILTMNRPWERRIEEAYKRILTLSNVRFDVFTLDPERLDELPDALLPKLDDESNKYFNEKLLTIKREEADNPRRLRTRIRDLDNERRTKLATTTPPYEAVLFALDAQTASLIKNRLPQRTRIWATSSSNPGDPKTSSSAAALAYDLENVVFTECPLVVRYDAQNFEARFGTAMPYSLAAKRLFALGVDAYEMAQQWAIGRSIIQFHGESGALAVDRKTSPFVTRTPQTVVIKGGHLIEVEPALLARPGDLPRIQEKPSTPNFPVNTREQLRTLSTAAPTITVETEADTPPSPPIEGTSAIQHQSHQ